MAAAPESDSSPTSSPALVLAVVPVSVTHPRSMSSRPLPASGPPARRLACRRRALETVKKVVTASATGVVEGVIFVVLAGQAASGRVLMLVGPRQQMFTRTS
jgi:hypothetical protein